MSNIASYTAKWSVKSMQSRVLQLLTNHCMISSESEFWQQKKTRKKTRTSLIYRMLEISLVTCFIITVNFNTSLFNQHFKYYYFSEISTIESPIYTNSEFETTDFWWMTMKFLRTNPVWTWYSSMTNQGMNRFSFGFNRIFGNTKFNVINIDIKVFFSNQYLQYDSMW